MRRSVGTKVSPAGKNNCVNSSPAFRAQQINTADNGAEERGTAAGGCQRVDESKLMPERDLFNPTGS